MVPARVRIAQALLVTWLALYVAYRFGVPGLDAVGALDILLTSINSR